jgi:hypothetical protein
MCFVLQMNRRMVRLALNALFTGDPRKDPALAKVLQSVGLDGKKPILHREHPVVVGTEEIRPLCPPDTASKSLLRVGETTCDQFMNMLGKFLLSIHMFIGSFGICRLNLFVLCLDRASS